MNKKRMAQYCCAALVAAGIGLNVQNALSDYGIGENSLSLVATGGTGSSGSCDDVSFYTVSGSQWEDATATIRVCGSSAGQWTARAKRLKAGHPKPTGGIWSKLFWGEMIIEALVSQITHYDYETIYSHTNEWKVIEGHKKEKIQIVKNCVEESGFGSSPCLPPYAYNDGEEWW